ncbi:MAG: class I SAM-dependent methyltransferase [Flavobacteriales bacterium]|nr:class I SAM-dependent methyltransferase [Flavobacteriales bacterium]
MKDRFSDQAKTYKKFRPTYPTKLYELISSFCAQKTNAWDCGTGNGQVAFELSKEFKSIQASDISKSQIDNGKKHPKISYSLQSAENTDFEDNTFDLICVAQAIHWFEHQTFFQEVKRVSKTNGILAFWGYGVPSISNKNTEREFQEIYSNLLGSFWDQERKHIEDQYDNINAPFELLDSNQSFAISYEWNHQQLHGYVLSWSASQNYLNQNSNAQIPSFTPTGKLRIEWPIFMKIYRINK